MIRFSALGDIVLTLPILEFLGVRSELHFLSHPLAHEILDLTNIRFLCYEKKMSLSEKFKLIFDLRRIGYDLVIDLQGNRFSRLLTHLIGAETIRLSDDRERHALENYAGTVCTSYPEFKLRPDYLLPVSGETVEIEKPYACLFFSSSRRWSSKRISLELADRIVDFLIKRGLTPVLIGGSEDQEYHQSLGFPEKVIDLTGKLNFGQLKALMSCAGQIVTTDSFPMHLAAFCGTPVIAFFGPTDERRCGPWSSRTTILTAPASCRTCYRSRCQRQDCLKVDWAIVRSAIEKNL